MAAKGESEERRLNEARRAVGSTATPEWYYRGGAENWLVKREK